MSALQNADSQADVIQQTVHREIQEEDKRLVSQLECRHKEFKRMKSAWKTAVEERDEVIQERDALRAELGILRAEKDIAVAKAKEEGRQEVVGPIIQSLQATIAIVGMKQGSTMS